MLKTNPAKNDRHMSKGHRRQLKGLPMASTGGKNEQENKIVLDNNPKYKINNPGYIVIKR